MMMDRHRFRQNFTTLLWRYVEIWSLEHPTKKSNAEHQHVLNDLLYLVDTLPQPPPSFRVDERFKVSVREVLAKSRTDYVKSLPPLEVANLLVSAATVFNISREKEKGDSGGETFTS